VNRLLLAGPCLMVLLWFVAGSAQEVVYEGPWHTTNRKLDGNLTCVVTHLGGERWQGRFYGIWQGIRFDHTVPFTGPPSDLRGTATIDGADYTWTGQIGRGLPGWFKGSFSGSRYTGYFDLRETTQLASQPKPRPR
jgi:hypothetical protein